VLSGGFSIDPACINTVDEFGLYSYPDNPKVETDKPNKTDDHAMDALRYLCLGITEPVIDLGKVYA
jgi:phage terminase large subunit